MRISLENAVTLLQNGHVVSIPTETVYGLAAWIHSPDAIQKVFALKKRPASNPLILHLAKAEQILHYVSSVPDDFFAIAHRFWPGPLTILLPVKAEVVPAAVRAGLDTCAFRVPSHPLARELLSEVFPLVAPSANLSGHPSSTKPEHVELDFGADFPVLDGASSNHGVESTIIAFLEGRWGIVRQGALSQEELGCFLGYSPALHDRPAEKPICPGQFFRHYAPKASLVLSSSAYDGSVPVVVGFSDREYPGAQRVFSLGSSQCADDAAFRLYDVLRLLDLNLVEKAWVDMRIPECGLWQTIRERLYRASV